MVAVLPMFEAVASASKYGSGRTRIRLQTPKISGRHHQANDVVHQKCGENSADEDDAGKKSAGPRWSIANRVIHSKKPDKCRLATISIMENNRTRVAKSMLARASVGPSTPKRTSAPRRLLPLQGDQSWCRAAGRWRRPDSWRGTLSRQSTMCQWESVWPIADVIVRVSSLI